MTRGIRPIPVTPMHGGTLSAGDESRTVVCAVPDASLSDVRLDGTSLIASVDFESESCGDSSYSAAGVQVTIQDDGNVVAAAIYDFGDAPLEFDDGTAQADLAFTHGAVLASV